MSDSGRDGWDDAAWASQSDDDDFVARLSSQRMARNRTEPGYSDDWTLVTDRLPSTRSGASTSPRRTDSGAARDPAVAQAPVRPAELLRRRTEPAREPRPCVQATLSEPDASVARWAESSLGKSHELGATARTKSIRAGTVADLDSVLEDPLAALATYHAAAPQRHTPAPTDAHSVPWAARRGDDVDEDVAAAVDTLSAPAFDPLATSGDGVIMTVSSLSTSPRASPTEPRGDAHQRAAPRDPAHASPPTALRQPSVRTQRRCRQLVECLEADDVDLGTLRSLAWKGLPSALRAAAWQLLLGYLPTNAGVRRRTLARKRAEYAAGVERAFARGPGALDQAVWHQIYIDVPRTNPGIRLWQQEATQRALERILYVWAIRHPASGYVQGINDLATPFFEVFLGAYVDGDPEMYELAQLPKSALSALEADTFWCLSRLLDGIHDNYIFAQPGIQRQLRRMGDVVARIDAPLHVHLASQGVEYIQFSFRWINCLLMREMSVTSIIRMWDTYLAEGPDAFADFHPFVCAVFLHKWRDPLLTMDFQAIIMFLQSLPTHGWSDKDAEMLLSEAFMYKAMFGNTAHLQG
ncbi:GTPase-activating protein [Malassezia sp. CBS 17886]|nr:GTPase-activating protein [Malassezia sp. CBS 17886]